MARPPEHQPATRPLPAEEARHLAQTIGAFGAASRLRLLWALIEAERSVEELTEKTGLTQSGTSQQLRVLREARLVKVRREGRRAFYSLYDHHVPDLLAAMRHVEQEKAGKGDPVALGAP
jgi:DNA-binding transcriptional ArsR family regulator